MHPFYVAVEGIADEAVASRILKFLGIQHFPVIKSGGKTQLKKNIRSYNMAANISPWFVLTDLDSPDRCPVEYAREWLANPNPQMVFRIAVPEIETWLLASRNALAHYMNLSVDLIPVEPEKLLKPKQELINLAARSRSRGIREDMRRADGLIGPAYTARVIEFATRDWDINEAMHYANSLRRCVEALRRVSKI
jgi:hypothetical protein